jgi:hypothetical protein
MPVSTHDWLRRGSVAVFERNFPHQRRRFGTSGKNYSGINTWQSHVPLQRRPCAGRHQGNRRAHAIHQRQALAAGLKPPNHKRVYRVMKVDGLLLDRHADGCRAAT